jgi:hypothetical protein
MEKKWVVRVAFVRPGSIVQGAGAGVPDEGDICLADVSEFCDETLHFGRTS